MLSVRRLSVCRNVRAQCKNSRTDPDEIWHEGYLDEKKTIVLKFGDNRFRGWGTVPEMFPKMAQI